MSWIYSCPSCKAVLNPHDTLVLVAHKEHLRLLIGLHPQPGNYQIFVPPGVEIESGSRWDFLCPACHYDLGTDFASDLCAVDVRTENQDHRIFFSRVAGEHATFVVGPGGLAETHGTEADTYRDAIAHMKYIL